MRIRARHIAVFAATAITLFMLYAITLREPAEPPGHLDGLSPPLHTPMDKAPEMALDTEHLDLGIIPNDRNTETEVLVYNKGVGALEVRDVRSSCPLCTRGYFERGAQHIASQQSSPLKVVVSPAGIYGFHSRKTLTLTSNDPRAPQRTLVVEAHVEPEFEIVPENFDFGDVAKGEPAQQTVLFRQLDDAPLTVTGVSLRPDDPEPEQNAVITFETAPVPESDRLHPEKNEYRITATLAPEMRGGDFDISVFLHIDLERFSVHRITAQGRIAAPYSLEIEGSTGELLVRGDVRPLVTVRAEVPVTLRDPRSENGFLAVQQRRESEHAHSLRCAPADMIERGIHRDHLLFEVEVEGVVYSERISAMIYATGITTETTES